MATRTTIKFNELPIEASNALSLDNINKLIANLGQRGLGSQPLGREIFRQAQLPSLNKALRAQAFIEEDRAKLLRAAEENQARLSRNAAIREQQKLQELANTPIVTGGKNIDLGFQGRQQLVDIRLPSGQTKTVNINQTRSNFGNPALNAADQELLRGSLKPRGLQLQTSRFNQGIPGAPFKQEFSDIGLPGVISPGKSTGKSLQQINNLLGVGRSTRR